MPTFRSPLKETRIVPKVGTGFGFRAEGGSVRVSIILGEGVAVVVRRERLWSPVRENSGFEWVGRTLSCHLVQISA